MRSLLIFLAAVILIVLGLWATLVLYFDEERLKQIATDQIRAQTGRELSIDGDLELDLFPGISIVARDVTLSGPDDYTGPDLFTADEFRMSVSLLPLLSGKVETGDISLENARLSIHTDRSGLSSLDGLSGSAEQNGSAPQSRPGVSTGRIALSKSTVTMSDETSDSRQIFVVERLQVDSFAFDRPVRFSFEGGIGDPPMVEDIDVGGSLTVPSGDGPIVVHEFGVTANAAGLPLGLSGRASVNAGPPMVAQIEDGLLDLNGKSFQVSFSYRDGTRPKVDAALSGEFLNVDALLAVMPGGHEAVAEAEDAESPLLLLGEFDVDARLELDAAILSGLELADVGARLRSDNGIVTVDPISGRLGGGRLDAVAMADLSVEPPLLQFDPVFDLDDAGMALSPWGMDRFLTGSGILELAVSARGLDTNAILSSLDGSGRYELRDGTIQGVDLNAMIEGLAAREFQTAVAAGLGGKTRFQTLSGRVSIKDGTVELPRINLVTGQLGATGDLTLKLADLGIQGELRLDSERLPAIPLQLGGTLLRPTLQPDATEALKQEAGRRVLDFLRERNEKDEEPAGEEGGG